MPRFLVERTFPDGLNLPISEEGANVCLNVIGNNGQQGVTWLHSYFTPDRKRSFCIYDGPSAEAIQSAADTNKLPVDSITEVRVLDPYFFR